MHQQSVKTPDFVELGFKGKVANLGAFSLEDGIKSRPQETRMYPCFTWSRAYTDPGELMQAFSADMSAWFEGSKPDDVLLVRRQPEMSSDVRFEYGDIIYRLTARLILVRDGVESHPPSFMSVDQT